MPGSSGLVCQFHHSTVPWQTSWSHLVRLQRSCLPTCETLSARETQVTSPSRRQHWLFLHWSKPTTLATCHWCCSNRWSSTTGSTRPPRTARSRPSDAFRRACAWKNRSRQIFSLRQFDGVHCAWWKRMVCSLNNFVAHTANKCYLSFGVQTLPRRWPEPNFPQGLTQFGFFSIRRKGYLFERMPCVVGNKQLPTPFLPVFAVQLNRQAASTSAMS